MKNLILGILALVAVLAVFMAVQAPKKSAADKAALENRVAALEAQLLHTQKIALELQAARRPKSASTPPAPTSAPALPYRDPLNEKDRARLEEISAHRLLLVAAGLYGDAITRLNLDSTTTNNALVLLAERYQVQMDTGVAARKAGITDPEKIKQLAAQELAKMDTEIKNTLGPELYRSLEDEVQVGQQQRMLELGFGRELTLMGQHLTPEQSHALAQAVWSVKSTGPNGSTSTREQQEVAEVAAVSRVLTEGQTQAYQRYLRDNAEFERLSRLARSPP